MPIVELKILAGRDGERIERLLANVAKTVAETLEVPPESVRVLLYELPVTHWAIGGETVKARREKTTEE